MPPIKPDGGGSLKSTANSCPAKPPIKEETMTCKKLSGGGKGSCPREPNATCRTIAAIMTPANAAMIANQSWLVNMLPNIRPMSPPPNAPVTSITITVAETIPGVRDTSILPIRWTVQHGEFVTPPLGFSERPKKV